MTADVNVFPASET